MSNQPALYRPRHVVVLCHPDAASFNGLVADAWCTAARDCGHEAIVRDLYALDFDPRLKADERPGTAGFRIADDVAVELDAIRGSDVLVLVYPIWFGMPPAMIVGYVDRVLGAGVTPEQVQQHSADTPFRGKRLVSITSSGASRHWLDDPEQTAGMRQVFGRYLQRALAMKAFDDVHFGETVAGLAQDFVDANLARVDDLAKATCAAIDSERA